jgi:hypothetical protein
MLTDVAYFFIFCLEKNKVDKLLFRVKPLSFLGQKIPLHTFSKEHRCYSGEEENRGQPECRGRAAGVAV